MQIDRLLKITLTLLNKGRTSAKQLSTQLGVSTRTIYRDIDALSLAGVPVYSTKGNGGGIGLLPEYTIDRSLLSEKEQKDIMFALQSLSAARFPDVDATLGKISRVFNASSNANWIEVDFSYWGSGDAEKEKFTLLKDAILTKRLIGFEYYDSYGNKTARTAEALKLIFKGQSWYLYGYCRARQDYRLFRVSRIRDLCLCGGHFERQIPENTLIDADQPSLHMTRITLKFSREVAHRVYDGFASATVIQNDDGTFTAAADYLYDEWVIGYILSFGGFAEVLEPDFVREDIAKRAEEIVKKYR